MNNRKMGKQIFISEMQGYFNLRHPKSKKPSCVYFVVRINGKQVKLPLGVKVYPHQWNSKKQLAYTSEILTANDNANNTMVNKRISAIKSQFIRYKEYLCEHPEELYIGKKLLKQFIQVKRIQMKRNNLNPLLFLKQQISADTTKNDATKYTYYNHITHFENYLKAEKIGLTSFDEITIEMIRGFQSYLQNLKSSRSTDGKLSLDYINNTIKGLIQHINVYVVHFQKMDVEVFNKIKALYTPLKVKVDAGENEISLTEGEVTKLWQYECKNEKDKQIKDLFLLQCTTGQRFSDIVKVADNIYEGDGIVTIQLKQKKSGAYIYVPLIFKIAKDILDKYPEGLPQIKSVDMNRRIKKIAKDAGICGDKKIVSRQTGKDNNAVTEEKLRYDLITSHTGRRTFITILSLRGYDIKSIKDYSGHKDTRTVERYIKTSAAERAFYDKLKKNHPELLLEKIGEENVVEQQAPLTQSRFKTNTVMDVLFGESTLLKLKKLMDNGLLNYQDLSSYEAQKAVTIIKDISSVDKVKEHNLFPKVDKQKAIEKTNALVDIVWKLTLHYCDGSIFQRFQYKVIQLRWTDKYERVMTDDEVGYLIEEEITKYNTPIID